jgi:hypothetical protein
MCPGSSGQVHTGSAVGLRRAIVLARFRHHNDFPVVELSTPLRGSVMTTTPPGIGIDLWQVMLNQERSVCVTRWSCTELARSFKSCASHAWPIPLCLSLAKDWTRTFDLGRITAKFTSYRVIFYLFSLNCKRSRLNPCRTIDEMRHNQTKNPSVLRRVFCLNE